MSANELIARGISTYIGQDVPNILRQAQQDKQQNYLAMRQDARAQGEYDQRQNALAAAGQSEKLKRVVAEAAYIAKAPPGQAGALAAQMPDIIESMRAHGVDPSNWGDTEWRAHATQVGTFAMAQLGQGPVDEKPITVAPGSTLIKPDGKGNYSPIYTAPKPEDFSGAPFAAVGADNKPGMFVRGNQGSIRPINGVRPIDPQGKPQLVEVPLPDGTTQKQWVTPGSGQGTPVGAATQGNPNQKTSDTERTAAGFLERMQKAELLLGNYKPSVKDFMGYGRILNGGSVSASVGNSLMSAEGQKYYQAASDWVRAKLRKESGAVIGPQEMEQEIRTYFPVPGDSEEVIAQKAAARATATDAMRSMAGPAAKGTQAPASNGWTVRKVK